MNKSDIITIVTVHPDALSQRYGSLLC